MEKEICLVRADMVDTALDHIDHAINFYWEKNYDRATFELVKARDWVSRAEEAKSETAPDLKIKINGLLRLVEEKVEPENFEGEATAVMRLIFEKNLDEYCECIKA